MSLSIEVVEDSTGNNMDDDDYESNSKSAGRWTQEEHDLFLKGLKMHNKQWKNIADMIRTRTVVQIRTHAQKYFQKIIKLAALNQNHCTDDYNGVMSVPLFIHASSMGSEDGYAFNISDIEPEVMMDTQATSPDHYHSVPLLNKKPLIRKRSRDLLVGSLTKPPAAGSSSTSVAATSSSSKSPKKTLNGSSSSSNVAKYKDVKYHKPRPVAYSFDSSFEPTNRHHHHHHGGIDSELLSLLLDAGFLNDVSDHSDPSSSSSSSSSSSFPNSPCVESDYSRGGPDSLQDLSLTTLDIGSSDTDIDFTGCFLDAYHEGCSDDTNEFSGSTSSCGSSYSPTASSMKKRGRPKKGTVLGGGGCSLQVTHQEYNARLQDDPSDRDRHHILHRVDSDHSHGSSVDGNPFSPATTTISSSSSSSFIFGVSEYPTDSSKVGINPTATTTAASRMQIFENASNGPFFNGTWFSPDEHFGDFNLPFDFFGDGFD